MTHLTWIVGRAWDTKDWLVLPAGRGWHSCHYGQPVAIFNTKKPALTYARGLRAWCVPNDIFFDREPGFLDLELLTMKHWMLFKDRRRKPSEGEKQARDKVVKSYPHDTQCDIFSKICGVSIPGGRIETCSCGATQLRRKAMQRYKLMM